MIKRWNFVLYAFIYIYQVQVFLSYNQELEIPPGEKNERRGKRGKTKARKGSEIKLGRSLKF